MIAEFQKAPDERKRYTIDYSQWLPAGETLVSASFVVTRTSGTGTGTELFMDGYSVSGSTTCVFYMAGGYDRCEYAVEVTVVTSANQIKQDVIGFNVAEPA